MYFSSDVVELNSDVYDDSILLIKYHLNCAQLFRPKTNFKSPSLWLVSRFHLDYAKEQPTLIRQTLVRWTNWSISWKEMLPQKLHMAIVSKNVTWIVRLWKQNHSSLWYRMPVSKLYNFPENLWLKYNFEALHSACFFLI